MNIKTRQYKTQDTPGIKKRPPPQCQIYAAMRLPSNAKSLQLCYSYSLITQRSPVPTHPTRPIYLLALSFSHLHITHILSLPPSLSLSLYTHCIPAPTPRLALRVCHMDTHTVNRSPRRVCSWMQSSFQKVHTKAYTNPSTRTGRRTSVAQGSS